MYLLHDDLIIYLLKFLRLSTVTILSRLCHRFYQIVSSTQLYEEIKIVSSFHSENKIDDICQLKLKRILIHLINHQHSLDVLANSMFKAGDAKITRWFIKYTGRRFDNYVKIAAIHGNLDVLEWCYQQGYNMLLGKKFKVRFVTTHNRYLVDLIVEKGHLKVLEWYQSRGLKFSYSDYSGDIAASNNDVAALDWFLTHKLKLKYSKWALTVAAINGRLAILDWFDKHQLMPSFIDDEENYYTDLVELIIIHDQLTVLDWFKSHGYSSFIVYNHSTVLTAISQNSCHFLDWFKNDGYQFNKMSIYTGLAIRFENLLVLDWFLQSGLEFRYFSRDLQDASSKVKEWFKEHFKIRR